MIDELLRRAADIRDEEQESHNTALRVGRLFVDIIRAHEHVEESLVDFEKEVKTWRWLRFRRGQWSEATARGSDPYRFYERSRINEFGIQYNQTVQDTVFRYGCEWGCLKDRTTNPPDWNSQDWMLIEGQEAYYLDFESTKGWQFFINKMDTAVTTSVYHNGDNITDLAMSAADTEIEWTRDTGHAAADRTWKPTLADGSRNVIHLTDADMGAGWGTEYRKISFTCTVYLQLGDTAVPVKNSINIKI